MNRRLSLGVIGHVDHGKTSLVKALTGMETDRLPEEKLRGMSIALGFAWLEVENGAIDLIDVPGHENFVRTMVSGATGIDASLLVVDGREGVKPQTAEHLAITQLLGIRKGVIAITKCDQLTPDQRAEIVFRLAAFLRNTYLAQAPVVFTSSVSGEGIAELRQSLGILLDTSTATPCSDAFYLPIDRVFTMAGSGTVVTGTLRMGRIAVGDDVEIMPLGVRSQVRQLECHGQKHSQLLPGQRVGVNLRHIRTDALRRGQVLSSCGLLFPSACVNVHVQLLKEAEQPLKQGQTARLLFGTTEVAARLRLLNQTVLEPGREGWAQLLLNRPVVASPYEPFILRSESPPLTIAGGRILDPRAVPGRSSDKILLGKLQSLTNGSRQHILKERIKEAGYAGISVTALAALVPCSQEAVHRDLTGADAMMLDASQVIYLPFIDTLADMCVAALRQYHRRYPARAGAPLAHCRAALPKSVGDRLFKNVMQGLCAAKRVEVEEGTARLFGYDPLSVLDKEKRHRAIGIEEAVRNGCLMPPDVDEVAGDETGLELLHLLVTRGDLALLPGEHAGKKVVFHRSAVEAARSRIIASFPPPVEFTVSEFRMLVGTTRKYAVPLLTYFDAIGVTKRQGDKRVVKMADTEVNEVW